MTLIHARRRLALAVAAAAASVSLVVGIGAARALADSNGEGAAGSVDLAPRFVVGETTTYEQALRYEQRQMIQFAANESLTAGLTRRFTLRVIEELEGGGARVELTFDRLALTVRPPRESVFEFDSGRPDEENPAGARSAVLRAVADAKVVLALGPAGEVRSLEGLEPVDAAFKANSSARDLAALVGRDWFRGVADEVWGVAGDKAERAVGEEWQRTSATRAGGFNAGETTIWSTLASVEGETATIAGRGETAVADLQPAAGVTPEVADQSMTFTITWDLKRGQLVRYETEQTITISQGGDILDMRVFLATAGAMKRLDPR